MSPYGPRSNLLRAQLRQCALTFLSLTSDLSKAMPNICYVERKFGSKAVNLISHCNAVIREYQRDGYDLTVRQLYYQLVSRDVIPNTPRSYQNICVLISNARRAGLIDWDAIVDRTRNLRVRTHWDSPDEILSAIGKTYHIDLWEGQENYVEVWFEKDALMGVFERAANPLDVPFFSCRGYASDSELWAAGQRISEMMSDHRCIVLHFSDHDPSGLNMTEDIEQRLAMFDADGVEVRRIALTMQQVNQYNPPPNPAKQDDPRFKEYEKLYGGSSWELDALNPRTLAALVRDEIEPLIDQELWDERLVLRAEGRAMLATAAAQWSDVEGLIKTEHRTELRSRIKKLRKADDVEGESDDDE